MEFQRRYTTLDHSSADLCYAVMDSYQGFVVRCRIAWLISHSHDYIDEIECIYIRGRIERESDGYGRGRPERWREFDWVPVFRKKKEEKLRIQGMPTLLIFYLGLPFSPSFLHQVGNSGSTHFWPTSQNFHHPNYVFLSVI